MQAEKIQKVELNIFYDISLFCPFCGTKVVDVQAGELGGNPINPCSHTLFIVTDEGVEFRSERFNENLGLTDIDDDDIELPERGWDGLTDQVAIQDAIKIASYVPAPSGLGAYVGFAPI
jgi:hypothetical protein